jgi:hypothetical protein
MPGHPATVCLSSLFKDIYTPSFAGGLTFNPLYYSADMTSLQNLLALTPRTLFGGSQFGTAPSLLVTESATTPVQPSVNLAASPYSLANPAPALPAAVDNKANRLYSSVDELLYGTSTAPVTARVSNPPNSTTNPNPVQLTPAIIQRTRFFATARSRAPEVTLFNTPRISMWPITWPWNLTTNKEGDLPIPDVVNSIQQNKYYTDTTFPMLQSTEKLLAYCGTVGGWPYYFQREDALSSINDWKYIPRNTDLIEYLQNLTQNAIPGYGGDFKTKYGADRDQILTEMLDFCRSGPNLNNDTTTT